MAIIPEEIIENLRKSILGKRVEVKTSDIHIVGICQFFGYNPYLPLWGLQVTVNRTPVTNLELSQIKLVDEV